MSTVSKEEYDSLHIDFVNRGVELRELQAKIVTNNKEFDFQVGKVNFRDSQLRAEREEKKQLQAENERLKQCCIEEKTFVTAREAEIKQLKDELDKHREWETSEGKRATHWKPIVFPEDTK